MKQCPSCGGQRIWKDGKRYTSQGEVQRYLCRSCGYRFSFSEPTVKLNVTSQIRETFNPRENHSKTRVFSRNGTVKKTLDNPSLPFREDVGSHNTSSLSTAEKDLNTFSFYNRKYRVCASEREAKNLVKVEPETQRLAGTTKLDEAGVKGKIVEYLWWMKKQGYKPRTIELRISFMRRLVQLGANTLDVESVKETIAKTDTWCETTKFHACNTYTNFLEFLGLTWKKPKYRPNEKIPFIPTEREIDQLIAHCGNKTATALMVAKETGARIGEILHMRWIDIDHHRQTLRFEAEKGSNSRILNVSSELIAVLHGMPKKNEYVFSTTRGCGDPRGYARRLAATRKLCARKLGNPRISEITFHTLRHWKGTMEYHKTKDIIHVKQLLGHKSINNTMIYINLERAIFKETNDEFIVKAVNNVDEAKKLIEVGFEYVTDLDDYKLFRKRK